MIASSQLSAQEITHNCGFDHWLGAIKTQQPERAAQIAADYNGWVRESSSQSERVQTVYHIPVVFHVVWNTESQNIPDSVIFSQIEVLNEDYRRLNTNADQTRAEFLPVAADVEIEFHLATIDPQGNPTNGIVRTETAQSGWQLDIFSQENTLDYVKFSDQGGSDAWDTQHYMNVWVCNIEPSLFGQIFGLAYPPNGTPNWPANSAEPSAAVSGVIVHYSTVGRNNPAADEDGVTDNNLGRTLVHETGHYFGLRHIWGDGFFNGCNADDGLADTPNCAAADNYQCNLNANTCTDAPVDFNDMIENYMDYSKESCQNMFTQEQKDMMRYVLENFRSGLIPGQIQVDEAAPLAEVTLFPNPAAETITLRNAPLGSLVSIVDLSGRTLRTVRISAPRQDLRLADLPAGYYLLNTTSGDVGRTLSFIKQ